MAITLIASAKTAGINGGTTAGVDTTGASLLVAVIASADVATTVSDSKGNTWSALTQRSLAGNLRGRIHYAANPTVGSGHTFTVAGASSFSVICAAAFSDVTTTSPFDQENGATTASATSLQTGSITPTESGEVIIAGLSDLGISTAKTITAGFTIQENFLYSGGANVGGALAYLIQGAAAAVNPQWGHSNAALGMTAEIASFKVTPTTDVGARAAIFRIRRPRWG